MAEISDINENKPHVTAEVICVKCLSRWYPVFPDDLPLIKLECPKCGPGSVILTGQPLEQ